MYVILGATGHVGSELASALLARGDEITVVTRSEHGAARWRARGAHAAVLDVRDVEALRAVFARARRAFVLNPPAEPASDAPREERRTAEAIVAAVRDSGLERVVLQSTYGAQPGEAIGDLAVLYELEQELVGTNVPTSAVRCAYFMSNWDGALESAREEGLVHTLFEPELALPMVAPRDVAALVLRLLTQAELPRPLYYIEGPDRPRVGEVARAFARALGREVALATIPEARWTDALVELGFSPSAAASMAAMSRIVARRAYTLPSDPFRGVTSLESYVHALATSQPSSSD